MRKRALLMSLIFCLMGILAGGALAQDKVKVGVILPLTGELAKFGEIERKSFILGVEEINAAGGVNGKKIELIIEDTGGKPDVGRSAVEKLISQDKVIVIGGGYSSSETWAAVAVSQQHKIPFLVNTGSADNITEQKWEYIFRLSPPVSEYPQAVQGFLAKAGDVKNVAIIYENTLFGQSGAKDFAAQCEKSGLKVLLKEGYESGAVDFKPLLIKVKSAKPDLIYMISYIMDASLLMRQSKELNINPKLFIGGAAGFTLPEFQKNAGNATEYVYSATLWTPSIPYPGAKAYFDKFQAKYNSTTEYHGAEAYACIYVIADALKRAKSLTPADVRESMAQTDMMTAFGPVKFISYGKMTQQNKLPTFLVQWQKGKLETVWPENVSTAKYIYPVPPWSKR
ncbi:MAG: ABC transporter substrate-binding protein [Deltaproteobacteria bacterium]|nr:ABC transporter substrate-binding protein [Deltaproteobacteria bacterium]